MTNQKDRLLTPKEIQRAEKAGQAKWASRDNDDIDGKAIKNISECIEEAKWEAQDTKSVKARDIEILSQVHAQLKHYLECEPVITGLWDDISQYTISLEGELVALKRGLLKYNKP